MAGMSFTSARALSCLSRGQEICAELQGYVSMDVQFKGKGGHSSFPPADGSQVGRHQP